MIPYLSHGLTEADAQAAAAEAIHDSVRPDHFATSQQPQQTPYMSLGLQAEFQAARPDDLADRFAHSDVAGRPEPTTAEGWRVEDDAIVLTIGTFSLSRSRAGAQPFPPAAARRTLGRQDSGTKRALRSPLLSVIPSG